MKKALAWVSRVLDQTPRLTAASILTPWIASADCVLWLPLQDRCQGKHPE